MRILTGHTSEETAFEQDDYPYGFRLRCHRRVWVETKPKVGQRFCAQTSNPKQSGLVWNKPVKSTYSEVVLIGLDESDNHIHHITGPSSPFGATAVATIDKFVEQYDAYLDNWQRKHLSTMRAVGVAYNQKLAARQAPDAHLEAAYEDANGSAD